MLMTSEMAAIQPPAALRCWWWWSCRIYRVEHESNDSCAGVKGVAVGPIHDERVEIGGELVVVQLRLEVGERSVDGPPPLGDRGRSWPRSRLARRLLLDGEPQVEEIAALLALEQGTNLRRGLATSIAKVGTSARPSNQGLSIASSLVTTGRAGERSKVLSSTLTRIRPPPAKVESNLDLG